MKKLMKKHLILALVVMAMVITTVFAVSAASTKDKYFCSQCGVETATYIKETVEAKCNSEGYDIIACTACDKVFTEIRANVKPAKGHKYGDVVYEKLQEDSTYYVAREYCTGGCGGQKTMSDKDGVIKYHKVTFVNTFVTKNTTKYGYTELADTTEYNEVVLAVKYIAEGKSVTNIGAKRDADKNYGAYELTGWTTTKGSATADYTTTVAIAKDDTVLDRTVYAVFKPVEVFYPISFYDDTGRLLSGTLPKITVKHGTPIELPANYTHSKSDDMTYRYEFSHWAVQGHSDVEIATGEIIYGKMNLEAVFTPVAKKYLLKYCYEDGTPIEIDGNAVIDEVVPGDGKGAVNGLKMNKNSQGLEKLYSYSTREYDYKFTGKWIVTNSKAVGRELDLNNMDLSGMLDTVASTEPNILIPKYKAIQRLYTIEIKVGYIDDMDATEHPTEATLQITDSSNNLVLTQKLTRNPEDAYYKYTAKVPYSDEYYRVSVVSGAYAGSAESSYSTARDRFSNVVFEMERKGKDNCKCFCHSLIKPIWIKVLNVIYSLFGKKIICCDDLFAENGHLLNYTAND